MPADELQDLEEHAAHAQANPSLAPVSLTMAVLAVLVAVATLLGHRAHTEEVVLQAKASDQWSYYQAKNIREHQDDLFVSSKANGASDADRQKYAQEAERYQHEKDDVQKEARELEREEAIERRRADRYDISEVFLEIGLVITSITLLSGRRIFWYLGIVSAALGAVIAVVAAVLR
jgi:hypothetical protein